MNIRTRVERLSKLVIVSCPKCRARFGWNSNLRAATTEGADEALKGDLSKKTDSELRLRALELFEMGVDYLHGCSVLERDLFIAVVHKASGTAAAAEHDLLDSVGRIARPCR